MKLFPFIFILFMSSVLQAQTVLNSPADAKKYPSLDLQNFRWANYVRPHYAVSVFEKSFLESDFFALTDLSVAEKVLFQKINLYRAEMGLKPVEWNETSATVARKHAEACAALGYIDHNLNGKTPTDRLQPHITEKIKALENLNIFGGTIKPESVDSYTDYVLHEWINSPGHNAALLRKSYTGSVVIFSLKMPEKNEHSTVSTFTVTQIN